MPARKTRVLVVDDRLEMAETIADGLQDLGYDAVATSSGRAALGMLEDADLDALVIDLRMPEVDGLELLAASREADPERPVIVMTAYGAIDSAIASIRQGAYHYLTKPFKLEELGIFLGRALEERRLRREAAALRTTLRQAWKPEGFIGESAAMREVLDVVKRVAGTDAPVLLTGETGTGKGMVARLLHTESPRVNGPFVTVNCAALPETLLESELFGHARGAFTGASQERRGLFSEASGGTLFLDEIGEIPLALQAKLLHVLESRSVRPLGSSRERAVDVRFVSATNRDLRESVRQGGFREDLLYRLDVVPLRLPALRERRDDIPALIAHFLASARGRYAASPVQRLSRDALQLLLDHRWPGNVRELAHVIERVVLLGRNVEVGRDELPVAVREPELSTDITFGDGVLPVRELQHRYAVWALAQCSGQRGRTAEKLGIDPKTLAKWLEDAQPTPAARRTPA